MKKCLSTGFLDPEAFGRIEINSQMAAGQILVEYLEANGQVAVQTLERAVVFADCEF